VSEAATDATRDVLELVEALASEIGPRRPTSPAEAAAARALRERLAAGGVTAELQEFAAYASFATPYGTIAALSLLSRRGGALGAVAGGAGALALALEGGLVHTPLSRLLARGRSTNVVATVPAAGRPARTVCLVAHLDSSRSGLLFDPRLAPYLQRWLAVQSVATMALGLRPWLGRSRPGRVLRSACGAVAALGLGLLLERELRGVDVPGANDNASGAAVATQLALEVAAEPLASTRLVLLVCGAEEAGLLGARAFLEAHDTDEWLFFNFDGVGAGVPLRLLPAEGLLRKWPADPALLAVAERLAAERPELGVTTARTPIGLTYDSTAVLAAGGRALTLVAADERGCIPHYHQESDVVANLDQGTLGRALEFGRALLGRLEAGAADRVRPGPEGAGS
jgi:hypothetical protein